MLGLRFCARAFSSCGKRGPLFIAVRGPLTIAASLVGSTGSRRAGSVVVAHGPSCSAACGILPNQGSNPCPLHWQADSQPLCHQRSQFYIFLTLRSDIYFLAMVLHENLNGFISKYLTSCIQGVYWKIFPPSINSYYNHTLNTNKQRRNEL